MDPSPASAGRQALWQQLGWQPSGEQEAQLEALQEQLRAWNSRVNLTRLVEGDDYWIAQVFDSLWPLVPLLQGHQAVSAADPLRLIDVGTGGGFPGLAVAIALPGARLTLVDSVGRKLEAVRAMAAALGLEGRLSLRCERIERTGRDPACRGRFDWALARAVAGAPVVAEYLVPLLRPDGHALLYRGQWQPTDREALDAALLPLRARVERCQPLELPCGRGIRHAVVLQPTGPCPAAYPRAVGVPARQPLGSPAPGPTGPTTRPSGGARPGRRGAP
ncbi:16S rRNA (guanine(527)-N(7))-methyltransferase RsmG [Cyanobium sp. CH-040]|uniref:16S rRNA (guanine(527)-N(7))-methyltransferase RsmG n=1 Tax=Cyanobium sp. CH-040 TaxID=2823708 RepID=UPI0020CE4BB6|nr:16S rRNA (guanine(527)-N(7))-methyltransferase RsmG [Cyanobium sp. CH-040]MCP9927977.1 16S rRNA (guanine(527)-N(7))-methyltransferase RsmG [Cyanobium sp. CH-040]